MTGEKEERVSAQYEIIVPSKYEGNGLLQKGKKQIKTLEEGARKWFTGIRPSQIHLQEEEGSASGDYKGSTGGWDRTCRSGGIHVKPKEEGGKDDNTISSKESVFGTRERKGKENQHGQKKEEEKGEEY